MFTPQEKLSAQSYVDGMVHLGSAVGSVAVLGETNGHILLAPIISLMDNILAVWADATAWFAGLSGTIGGDRAEVLAQAKTRYDAMLMKFPALLESAAADPLMAGILAKCVSAQNALKGFNPALAYIDPRHQAIPGLPFHADKTVVGPHGDWSKATSAMQYTVEGIGDTLKTFIGVYRTAPIYTELANHALQEQLKRFGKIMDMSARVWSMHIEVEYGRDRDVIDGDLAASPTTRGRGFIRTLRQNELLFSDRISGGPNWRGRNIETGLVSELRTLYFQEFIVPLGRANGKQWAYSLVVGDGNGGLHGFVKKMADFWQAMDSGMQSMFGFYHPLPDRTLFEPVHPDGTTQPVAAAASALTTIPSGFFEEEFVNITRARADVAEANATLSTILASLRAKEGMTVTEDQ